MGKGLLYPIQRRPHKPGFSLFTLPEAFSIDGGRDLGGPNIFHHGQSERKPFSGRSAVPGLSSDGWPEGSEKGRIRAEENYPGRLRPFTGKVGSKGVRGQGPSLGWRPPLPSFQSSFPKHWISQRAWQATHAGLVPKVFFPLSFAKISE